MPFQTTPGVQFVYCADATLKQTGDTRLELQNLAVPESDVLCELTADQDNEVSIEQPQVSFPSDEPLGTKVASAVAGHADLVHGDGATFGITARCSSGDRRFESATIRATEELTHVHFSRIGKIAPVRWGTRTDTGTERA